MDHIKSGKSLRKTKKRLKHRFQTEIYPVGGARECLIM